MQIASPDQIVRQSRLSSNQAERVAAQPPSFVLASVRRAGWAVAQLQLRLRSEGDKL